MKRKTLLAVCGMMAAIVASAQNLLPYQDWRLSPQQRADDLIPRLTLQEKAQLMIDVSEPVERLGIPTFQWWNEALHGIGRNGNATVFPITMGMAASWNDQLVYDCFNAASDEARIKNQEAKRNGQIKRYQCLSFWTPNINIFRDPRWGRGQETYGEDPYLTTRMALAVVKGLQGNRDAKYRKLLACAKHFAVHSGPEWNRHSFNIENLPPRDLWETYLPAFKALVQEGEVAEVMCAYQRFDGQPCCGNNRLLQQILRDEWGFKGIVVTDCGALADFYKKGCHEVSPTPADAAGKAIAAGTDVNCGKVYRSLPEAVAQGLADEKKIDESLKRLFVGRFLLGDMTPDSLVPWTQIPPQRLCSKEHNTLAYHMAQQSIVLLQNKRSLLPLKKSGIRVAVMGPNANDSTMQWGNYNGFPLHTVTLLEGITNKLAGQDAEVKYIAGCGHTENEADIDRMAEEAAQADIIIFAGGISPRLEGEQMKVNADGFKGGDRTRIELPQAQRQMLAGLHKTGKPIVYVNFSGSAIALTDETNTCDAILQAWYPGERGGDAVADVIFGDYNPGGKLPVTFYRSTDDLPDYMDYSMANRTYRYFKGKPLWHFGQGLSYTTFAIGKPSYDNGLLRVNVSNKGNCDGDEVVQVYIRRVADKHGPQLSLKAFRRIHLKAGEQQTVEFSLPATAFEVWDESSNTMRPLPGKYDILVGNSSRMKDLKRISITL